MKNIVKYFLLFIVIVILVLISVVGVLKFGYFYIFLFYLVFLIIFPPAIKVIRKKDYKWLIPILLIPFIGSIIYYLAKDFHPRKKEP